MSIPNFTSEETEARRVVDEVKESVYISQDTDTGLVSIIRESLHCGRFLCYVFGFPEQNVGQFWWVFW